MRARTISTTGPAPRYGVPSPALLARADRGYERFLAQQTEDQEHDGSQAMPQGRVVNGFALVARGS
ncbi:hypothetical protein QFZ82_000253 [Streptomyces sp. V4I23]|uniref:hypothetical protein n=1 Tax=Streptomyces sp. V4I23 TaxID=3042282 RepID=UPI00277D1CA7|nr:hypothetical protein [Streptomyces sp. V4I23]MDQ1005768.1 hypothetical protein [Streptomyces sp. V4I23]